MISVAWAALFVVVLAAFLGYELIRRVPTLLHTPLMSGSNFIHGIVLIGAIVALGTASNLPEQILGFLAVIMGAMNVTGGYVVTERILEIFDKSKQKKGPA